MAIGGTVPIASVRHMHSTVERETDQLKNADAEGKIGVSAEGASDCDISGPIFFISHPPRVGAPRRSARPRRRGAKAPCADHAFSLRSPSRRHLYRH
jgi:hypothetical protein